MSKKERQCSRQCEVRTAGADAAGWPAALCYLALLASSSPPSTGLTALLPKPKAMSQQTNTHRSCQSPRRAEADPRPEPLALQTVILVHVKKIGALNARKLAG